MSYLENDNLSDPHCLFDELLKKNKGIIVLSGSIDGLIGNLFNKGLFEDIDIILQKLNENFPNNFYIEIQRHGDLNEKQFEIFNLNQSKKYKLPIIATNEVYYLDKSMNEAHDALMCIGQKTNVNDNKRIKLSKNHYFK